MAGRQVAPRLHDIVQAIDNIKPRYPDIPWAKVAGIGNVLRHDYERVAPPVL